METYEHTKESAQNELLSQIAHDIRTSLNTILGFVPVLQAQRNDPEKVKSGLEKIQTAGIFLQELADDILDIVRLESNELTLQPKLFHLSRLLEEIQTSFLQVQSGKGTEPLFDIHDISQDQITADPARLKQILSSLFFCSLRYAPDEMLRFEIFEEPSSFSNQVILNILIGNSMALSSKKQGQQLSSALQWVPAIHLNQSSGYGLGPVVARRLTELMNGQIEIGNGSGKILRLRFSFPFEDSPAPFPFLNSAARNYDRICSGMHLLVAEDNELNYEVTEELLALHGITCDHAADGILCVERFRTAPPDTYDAILMDVQMPNMNGLEATTAIRALPLPHAHTVPIIAMTANAFREDIQNCIDAGMTMHMAKPIDIQKLLKALASVRT